MEDMCTAHQDTQAADCQSSETSHEPSTPKTTLATQPDPVVAAKPPISSMATEIPTIWQVGDIILDLYDVMALLGEGGMGTVHKIHHKGWNVDLAVKSPRPTIFTQSTGQTLFIREAETWVNLGLHPHIVSCYYVRTMGSLPRIFAEFVEGGSLADWIHDGRLYADTPSHALARILDIAIQVAWGLDYAHQQGLIHRDVKPANVMLLPDGTAKVTDFGLAKARVVAGEVSRLDGRESILISGGGMTPAYCSPEQAEGKPLSRATDVWSWAVSVLELFVGEVTWPAGQVAGAVLERYLEDGSPGPHIPTMPVALAEMLRRCFALNPGARPSSMGEVVATLRQIYEQETGQLYTRQVPNPVKALADSLNNQALSLLDLGKQEEAERLWEQALQADPHHPESTYNWEVIRWRRGEVVDDVLVQHLEAVLGSYPDLWRARYLLAQMHLERGDLEAAIPLLEEAIRLAPGQQEMQHTLDLALSGKIARIACHHTFQDHTKDVKAVSLSADGRWILSGGDNTLHLWDAITGNQLRTFEGHTAHINSVSLSADGRLALSGSGERHLGHYRGPRTPEDNSLRLWDVATGRCLHIFQGHTEAVTSVFFSADGRLALSGSEDHTVRLWDIATGNCLRIFLWHTDCVTSVSLSADGRVALSAAQERTENPLGDALCLWDVQTGKCLRTFEGHEGKVTSVSLNADGRLAVSASESADRTVRVWEAATGRCLRTFEGHTDGVAAVGISADGRFIVSGGHDQTVRVWEVATGRCLRTFEGHAGKVTSVSLSPDGRFVASGSDDRTVRAWKMPREHGWVGAFHLSYPRSHEELSLIEARVSTLLKRAEEALQEERFTAALDHMREIRSIAAHSRTPQSMKMWSRLSRVCLRVGLRAAWEAQLFEGHTDWVTAVSLSADGRWALSASCDQDQTLRLWEVSTGKCLQTFPSIGEVSSISLSEDGQLAVSGSYDRTVRVWELATGRCLHALQGHTGWVNAVSLSADGRWVLSGGKDKIVRLRDVTTGRCLHRFEAHRFGVHSVHLSPHGPWALSAGFRTIRLWNTITGDLLQTVEHDENISTVCLTADGRFVVAGGWDNTVRLWDLMTGQCLWTSQGHADQVCSVCLSADGRFALSGSHDKTVRLWELDWELSARDPDDWDEVVMPYIRTFLTLHTPRRGLFRWSARPSWTEEDFDKLIRQLQYAGYGWLRPEGVRRKLAELVSRQR
jgi:WD40 repeat protein/serine/threonine protein kinase